jgi:nucleoside-diphosphate kinase
MATAEDRFVFLVEWYDAAASLVRNYHLTYYPKDKTIEMFDLKSKKLFLKRCEYPNVTLADLYLGSIVNIYSRQLKIVDYADTFTRKNFETSRER